MRRRSERRRAAAAAAAAKSSAALAADTLVQTTAAAGSSTALATDALMSSSGAADAPLTSARARKPLMIHPAAQFKLHVHGHEFQNGEELVLNPEYFPQLKELHWEDYVVEVFHPRASPDGRVHERASEYTGNAHDAGAMAARQHLLLEISPSGIVPIRGKLQVSVLKDTAADFQLAPFKDVMVRFVAKAHVEVDFVEVSLKDQFMSRRDLWYLKKSVQGAAVYVGKNIRVHGTRWQVMDIRAGGEKVASGVISARTKFAFRSRTSRVMWLVQVSPELWDVANSGQLYLEILLRVVQHVLSKWMKHKVSHSLTIIFFARNYYPDLESELDTSFMSSSSSAAMAAGLGGASASAPGGGRRRRASSGASRTRAGGAGSASSKRRSDDKDRTFPYERRDYFPIGVDENGRHFQDFYKVVAFDSLVTDVEPLLVQLKRELNDFPHACGWRSSPSSQFYTPAQASPVPTPFVVPEGVPGASRESMRRLGVPSYARDGNLLEAINLVLNIFEKHHIDRHLARSGQSVVLMTAGNGIFSVNKRLAEITEQRMMDHGIGIDLISLATPPLHKCPLFLFKQSELTEMKLPSRAGEVNAVADMCLCANQAAGAATAAGAAGAAGANPKANAFQRRSRTASTDGLFDSQSIADAGVASVRANPLCKYCTQRLEDRKNYVIPLWIPLCFVEEDMMVAHACPLDEDISRQCAVCHPKEPKTKDFVPLPMCRMFKDDDDDSNRSVYALPKPLEKLLSRFEPTDSDQSESNDGSDERDGHRDLACTMLSEFSTYNDLLFAGFDSDLVRARSPSIASVDDLVTYGGGDMLPKARAYSPSDRSKVLQEFEKYDDQVFGFSGSRSGSALPPKSSDGGGVDRLLLTPPLGPRPPPGSHSKKRAGKGSVMTFFQSNSGGNTVTGVGGGGGGHDSNAPSPWRQRDRSPSPLPLHGSASSGSKFVSSSSSDDDGDGEMSSLDFNKPRNIAGSLPSTYQLDSGPSYAPYPTSPMLRPGDGVAKDDLFSSQAYIFSSKLTSNQRRWSQIRPSEDAKYRLVQNMLKWKSLCFPALLPLTSDFYPTSKELQAHYQESFYSVTLPERDEQNGVTFRDYREFVTEMVAQRFSQDFQLVTVDDSSSGGDGDTATAAGTVFRLSMGHRIHEITFNAETETIDVKRYVQKIKVRSDVDIMEYRYSLWSPVARAFLSVSQEFRKYPRLEYAWNYLDQLICGYYDEMSEAIRYKRILYCIVPPRLDVSSAATARAQLQDYTERCTKFIEYLRSKSDTGFPSVAVATDQWHADMARSGVDAFKRVFQSNVKIPVTAPDAPTSQNWVITRVDLELLATQCYHIEVQWLVCRSALVDDFITGIVRRAKQLGLEFLQVPENGVSSNLDLHPMICPIFLSVSDPHEQRLVEHALIERFHFCCEALHPIPFTHLNHGDEYAIPQQEPRGVRTRRVISYYRQYVHRTLPCYVRMTQTGLVWISNRKLACDDVQAIFDGLRQLIASVRVARAALADVVDRVFDTRDTAAATAAMAVAAPSSPAAASSSASEATGVKRVHNRHGVDGDADADADADDESGFASEGDRTETATTDDDGDARGSSDISSSAEGDEDKENAAPLSLGAANALLVASDADAPPSKEPLCASMSTSTNSLSSGGTAADASVSAIGSHILGTGELTAGATAAAAAGAVYEVDKTGVALGGSVVRHRQLSSSLAEQHAQTQTHTQTQMQMQMQPQMRERSSVGSHGAASVGSATSASLLAADLGPARVV